MKLITSEQSKVLRINLAKPTIENLKKQKHFRIRSASKSKKDISDCNYDDNKQQRILLNNGLNNDRSSSLKTVRLRKYFKKINTHADQSDEDKLAFQRALKTQQDNFEKRENKYKHNLKQLAQIFNIKAIMKMKNKKSAIQESSIKQDKKKLYKGHFRSNKFVAQQQIQTDRDLSSQQYWKKVNESLIFAERQAELQQPSKDLKQICQRLTFQ